MCANHYVPYIHMHEINIVQRGKTSASTFACVLHIFRIFYSFKKNSISKVVSFIDLKKLPIIHIVSLHVSVKW